VSLEKIQLLVLKHILIEIMEKPEDKQHLKKLAKGAGIAFFGLFIAKILTYAYRILIGRYFGPGDYGLFSIGLAVFTIFSVFATLGFNNTIVHYISYFLSKRDDERVRGVILYSLKVIIPVSLILTAILYLFSDLIAVTLFHSTELTGVFQLFSIALPFYTLVLIGSLIFVGFQKIKYQVYTDHLTSNIMKIGFLGIFILIGLGITGIVISWVLGTVAASLLSIYYIFKIFPPLQKTKPVYIKREMVNYSLPLFLSSLIATFYLYTDILLLGYFPNITISDIGVYSASSTIAQLLGIISIALTALFLPILTELHASKQKQTFDNIYRTVTRWAFFVNTPALLMMLFFSRQIIRIFFGPDFISGSIVLVYLGVGYLFFSISHIPFLLLNSIKRNKTILHVSIGSLIVGVALAIFLIPAYGLEGAALAVMVSNIIRFSLLIVASYAFVSVMPIDKDIVKSLISGLMSLLVVNFISRLLFGEFPILIMIFLFGVFMFLYLSLLLVMKGFGRDDLEIMKYMEHRFGIRIGFLRGIIKRFV
jgi:O-antigen/teichoic acid export membrane protein